MTEQKTKKYFKMRGFALERIPEGTKKTPDFGNGEFLVEVKQIAPLEEEGLHQDSTYNAIKNNLRDSARKFYSFDPEHKRKHIVIVFSDEIIKEDIHSVWTGEWSPDIRKRIFRGGMVLSGEHRRHIDAIAWFRNISDSIPKHIWLVDDKTKVYFGGS